MSKPRDLLRATAAYLRSHPEEVWTAAKDAASMRLGLPVAALRWAAKQLPEGGKAPGDVTIDSVPPALRLSATLNVMGAPLRATPSLGVEGVQVTADAVRLTLSVRDLNVKAVGGGESPVAGLLESGAIDLSKPGKLLKFLPKKPAFLLDAYDDKIVVDLMKLPALANNPIIKRALSVMAPVLRVRQIGTSDDRLFVQLGADMSGIRGAFDALRKR